MDAKAKMLLGLDQEANEKSSARAVGSATRTNLYVQKKGFLSKKPFSAPSMVKHQKWQRRWFVLKDSFLIWYKSKPSKGDFDLHPAGVLPLGGSDVFPQGKSEGGYEFELTHPDFNDSSLLLRSPNEEDANDWIRWLGLCKEATWENAMLGDAQMMSLKTKDTKLEKEAEATLQKARQNAKKIQEKRLERQKLMEEQEKRQMKFKEELRATKIAAEKLKKAEAQNLEQVAQKKAKAEKERAEQAKVEQQLLGAREALLKLEGLLEGREGAKKEELLKDINELKGFLEANISDLGNAETMSVTSYEPENEGEDGSVV